MDPRSPPRLSARLKLVSFVLSALFLSTAVALLALSGRALAIW